MAMTPSEPARRVWLRQILRDQAMISGTEMQLASGRTSMLYFNVKRPLFNPEFASLVAEEILDRLKDLKPDSVGGMALGAIPIVAAVCAKSFPHRPVRGFFVRREVKEHGTQSMIEGCFQSGDRVVLLEDVTTSGGSALQAAKTLRRANGEAQAVVTIIDRLEGAKENLAAEGIELIALFTKDDFRS